MQERSGELQKVDESLALRGRLSHQQLWMWQQTLLCVCSFLNPWNRHLQLFFHPQQFIKSQSFGLKFNAFYFLLCFGLALKEQRKVLNWQHHSPGNAGYLLLGTWEMGLCQIPQLWGRKKKKSGLEEFPAVVNDLLNLNLSESLWRNSNNEEFCITRYFKVTALKWSTSG